MFLDDLEGEDGEICIESGESGQVYSPPQHAIDPNITSMSTLPVSFCTIFLKREVEKENELAKNVIIKFFFNDPFDTYTLSVLKISFLVTDN